MRTKLKTIMRRIFNIAFAVAIMLPLVTACTDSSKKELASLVRELAEDDATIDSDDWRKIIDFMDANKAHMKEFYKDGKPDEEAVKEYIRKLFSKGKDQKEITFWGKADKKFLTVKFYLERSGSMVNYDSPQTAGEFKKAIVKMLNSLPSENDDNTIFVVNDAVYKYPKSYKEFVKDNNIFKTTEGIGDPKYTDFGLILDSILNKNESNELSILVSDMIYSTRDLATVNKQKVLNETEGVANAVFKEKAKCKSMLIMKMSGTYSGNYYPYNTPSNGKEYHGKRPYYVLIVGDNDDIARLTNDPQYAAFAKFGELEGFEHKYLFDASDAYKPFYTVMLRGKESRGEFRPTKGQTERITSIEDVKADRNSDDLQIEVAVNLGSMLIENDYLTNPKNYLVKSDDPIEIKSIRAIGSDDRNSNNKKYLDKATHIITLKMSAMKQDQEVSIRLLNRLPEWIAESSSEDDTNFAAADFPNTTFGLKYLLQGIYDSYKKLSDGEPYYFDLKLKMKR